MSASLQSDRRTRAPQVVEHQRGMRGFAAALFAFLVAAVGGTIDGIRVGGLGTIFAACLIGGTAIAALAVRRASVLWVVLAPPLICVVVALVSVVASSHSAVGLAADYLTHGFPTIAIAVAVGAAIAAIRLIAKR